MWPEDTYISCPEEEDKFTPPHSPSPCASLRIKNIPCPIYWAPLVATWSTLSSGPDEDEAPASATVGEPPAVARNPFSFDAPPPTPTPASNPFGAELQAAGGLNPFGEETGAAEEGNPFA